jgi:hypothetical protein
MVATQIKFDSRNLSLVRDFPTHLLSFDQTPEGWGEIEADKPDPADRRISDDFPEFGDDELAPLIPDITPEPPAYDDSYGDLPPLLDDEINPTCDRCGRSEGVDDYHLLCRACRDTSETITPKPAPAIDWSIIDTSLATDAELAPLPFDDEPADPLPGSPVFGLGLDSLCTPTRLGTVTKRGNMLCTTSGYDLAMVEGFAAGLDELACEPPYGENDLRRGAWLQGWSESGSVLMARELAHLAEVEEHVREMDVVCSGHPWL